MNKSTKTTAVKKVQPNQREVLAGILKSLPKKGLTVKEIADQIRKKSGSKSGKSLETMCRDLSNFVLYFGVITKKEDKYYKI